MRNRRANFGLSNEFFDHFFRLIWPSRLRAIPVSVASMRRMQRGPESSGQPLRSRTIRPPALRGLPADNSKFPWWQPEASAAFWRACRGSREANIRRQVPLTTAQPEIRPPGQARQPWHFDGIVDLGGLPTGAELAKRRGGDRHQQGLLAGRSNAVYGAGSRSDKTPASSPHALIHRLRFLRAPTSPERRLKPGQRGDSPL